MSARYIAKDGPIAMAPTDGTPVILVFSDDKGEWPSTSRYYFHNGQWRSCSSGFPTPSHCQIVGFRKVTVETDS